ncbi:anti-CBASS protein Acb1 family protein [Borrelia duttonii]|uniref:Uncharacterized conserved protein n=2 Tax=Borrelia duttonii TaxID=40834 RepID=B5RNP5_BORDL|nr:uncharacterized conserved protein [Borrelia duttonii Ly]
MKYNSKINSYELYKHSIFFRNYINNVAEDVLHNGINLEVIYSTALGGIEDTLDNLKVELKEALLNCIISYRFNGIGYILVKTAGDDNLDLEINSELPIGFVYLDFGCVRDRGSKSPYVIYSFKEEDDEGVLVRREVKIHKSRLIIYENYDYILGSYTPCYTQSFLLNVALFETIYQEIDRRIRNYNFLFYKDESLAEINDAISKTSLQFNLLTKSNKDNSSGMFKKLFRRNSDDGSGDNSGDEVVKKGTNILNALNNDLSHELERLKSNLNNDGIFYSGSESAHLEVMKYELTFLKDTLELVKAKIGADTKEPLTRSFNEQTKGLGNDGKGDRSNYYDFLKGVQERIEIAVNQKLNQYFGLDMRFNSLILLSETDKIEHDIKLLELFEKYKSAIGYEELSEKSVELLKDKLFFGEIFLGG